MVSEFLTRTLSEYGFFLEVRGQGTVGLRDDIKGRDQGTVEMTSKTVLTKLPRMAVQSLADI